jgi:hypothetical protein
MIAVSPADWMVAGSGGSVRHKSLASALCSVGWGCEVDVCC